MTVFGDYDPDDAYDASDPIDERLRVIVLRIVWLIGHRDDLPERVQRIVDDLNLIRAELAEL